jgi:hypothetical protein
VHLDGDGRQLGESDTYLGAIVGAADGGVIAADHGGFQVVHLRADAPPEVLVPTQPGAGLSAFRPEGVAVTPKGANLLRKRGALKLSVKVTARVGKGPKVSKTKKLRIESPGR